MKIFKFNVCASPNLALIKYWGKDDDVEMIPATGSIGLTLRELVTRTNVTISNDGRDSVILNGEQKRMDRYYSFFEHVRFVLKTNAFFNVESETNFPTSAGFSSSSSGFATLAAGCMKALEMDLSLEELSSLARVGSISAARSVLGGFVALPRRTTHAVQLFSEDYWPELRVLVVTISNQKKVMPSRDGMVHAKKSSPIYEQWKENSEDYFNEGLDALKQKDLKWLGRVMQKSTMGMVATWLTSEPPIYYLLPDTWKVFQICESLRRDGIEAYETVDAGPQVKIVCEEKNTSSIHEAIHSVLPGAPMAVCSIGSGVRVSE